MIFRYRKSKLPNTDFWRMTEKYCRIETIGSAIFWFACSFVAFFIVTSPVFLELNRLSQPMNFCILLLPYEKISLNWFLNYALQFCLIMFGASFFYSFISISLYIMNHSCWSFDNSLILVEQYASMSQENDENDLSNRESSKKQLKEIYETSCSVLEWLNEAQDLLRYCFLVDMSLQSAMTGLCLATLVIDNKTSGFVLCLLSLPMGQLFVNCWLGERVVKRIEMYIEAIYDLPWYSMNVKQRKELSLVLTMSQNMRGFNGVFKEVNMETFQSVRRHADK